MLNINIGNRLLAGILLLPALAMMTQGSERLHPLYYGALVIVGGIRLLRCQQLSGRLVIVLLAGAAGILLNSPPEVFRSWQRLLLFGILLAAVGPMFIGQENDKLSARLFSGLTTMAMWIAALSPLAAVFGFGHTGHGAMAGALFCGLTPHSMILGTLAGIGLLKSTHRLTVSPVSVASFIIPAACTLSLLLASSRAAVVATAAAMLWLLLHQRALRRRLWILLLIPLALLPFAGALTNGLHSKTMDGLENGGIFNSRAELWHDRLQEFLDSPLLGVGFASQKIITFAHSLHSGIIEPGSSYLGSLAMLGLAGSLPLFSLLGSALANRPAHASLASLPYAVFIFFLIHMLFEGYILSGGSILCLLLWSTISAVLIPHHHGTHSHL